MKNTPLQSIALHFDAPVFDLDSIDVATIPMSLIDEKLIRMHHILPLLIRHNQLYVATDNPNQIDALNKIQFHTGLQVLPLLVEKHKLVKLINQLLNTQENQGLADYAAESMTNTANPGSTLSDDKPVVKFIQRILLEAITQGASDIHFEPYENNYRIRYRQDGLLITVANPPTALSTSIAVRLKVLANLDIAEQRLPQDGRFGMQASTTQTIYFRVSTCPTVHGEKIVLRILDTKLAKPDIDTLGFNQQQKAQFLHAVTRPQGMVLVTGPTGSGKSMTLYSAITLLNTGEKNISTIEDPVEISIQGINQININPKAGLEFAKSLRALLRQDPDVIMLGEIRDLETAEIAIKAAQTGHMVLATLHTNSATETLTRLLNMGIPAFNIASSVTLIIAQRLVRRLCNACKTIRQDESSLQIFLHEVSEANLRIRSTYQAQGCNQCTNGYRGRIALFEIMPVSKNMADIIMSGDSSLNLLKHAKTEGMLTLLQAGLEKVMMGLTSIEEIIRVVVE